MVNLTWDWNSTESKGNEEYKRLVPGGYVARITKAENVPEYNRIDIEFDIAEGEYKGYAENCIERHGFNPLKMRRYYDTNRDKSDPEYDAKRKIIASMFKGFVECFNDSNPNNPAWDFDEKKLVGKYIGVVLGEEEYKKQDGSVGTRFNVARTVTPATIRAGSFKIPAKKTLPVEQTATFTPIEDTDGLPF